MPPQLITYSLIRSLYDLGDDIIDSFWPLVLTVLPQDRSGLSMEAVQREIDKKYGLEIPEHSLGTIIRRASRKNYLERKDKHIMLTQAGSLYYYEKIEPLRLAEQRVTELLADAKTFIDRRTQTEFSPDQIKEMIQAFVLDNLETVEQFFHSERTPGSTSADVSNEAERALLDYFNSVEITNPPIFRTLHDIVCGSVISAVVRTEELFRDSGKRFERTAVYLDSNYIFSLLDLRYPEENKPARELFRLMNEEDAFDFRVFDFTIHEITGLLRNYEREERYYQANIKVRGDLYASLKAQGWTAAKVREFIVNVEAKLWDKLKVKIAPTEINIKNYQPNDVNRREILRKYKPDQALREQNHDLAAIDQIRSIRRKEIKRLEKCEAMFLTSDLKLALFNYHEEHKENDSISEVIPDRLLTNILWLKNPAADQKLTLDSIIANYSRNLFVDQAVWRKFYKNVTELKHEGGLDDTQVSILLYDRHLQEVLSEYDPEEVEELDPTRILKDIEKIRATESQVVVPASPPAPVPAPVDPDLQLRETVAVLEQKVAVLQQEKNEMELNTIERWKKLREYESENTARAITRAIEVLFVLALFAVSYYAVGPIVGNWSQLEPIAWLGTVVTGVVFPVIGVRLDPLHWRPMIYSRIFNIVLRRKLESLKRLELNFVVDTEPDA